ncbi:MAG: hypothetical protein DRJ38_04535 [Thermoprotei archaeon]|nr:MAG: hypothetical protein DRJ38_04535 [Thermoprotei archaeon]
MALPKALQKEIIERMVRRVGIDPSTVDLEALIDPNLELSENVAIVERELGVSLRANGWSEDDAKRYEDEMNNELLRRHLDGSGVPTVEELEAKEVEHTQEMYESFEEIVSKTDPLEYFSKLLFPEILGDQYEPIRKAVLLSLATHYDRGRRTRIHVLIIGPPGTAKTEILKWISSKLGAAFINGEYVSKVGLTGDARGKQVTPGILADYDGHIVCIDELDKIPPKDQSGLLQAMEEGFYTIVKGKHRARFRAEVRVIASANDKSRITTPLLDRFDFVFELRNPDKEERAKHVDKLVEQFFGEYKTPDTRVLLDYLQWITAYEPKVKDIDKVKEVMKAYIELTNIDFDKYSYRSLELSILRIAYAIAKLSRNDITPEHIVKAITLKDHTLTKEQIRYLYAVAKGLI